MNKPNKLKLGDTIGLISPAGPVTDPIRLAEAVREIENRGFKVAFGQFASQPPFGYLSGTDDQRRSDLKDMLQRSDIKGIFCLKGGYGALRLLGTEMSASFPTGEKVFLGFSDITTLLLAGYASNKGILFHGPMPLHNFKTSPIATANVDRMFKLLSGDADAISINLAEGDYSSQSANDVRGTLWGGNLSTIASLSGTPFISAIPDSIIFFEEVDEHPYAIDRYLTHIEHTGIFSRAKAFIVGDLVNCIPDPGKPSFTAREVIQERLSRYGVPIVFTDAFGHGERMSTIPIGIRATLKCGNGLLLLDESPVS